MNPVKANSGHLVMNSSAIEKSKDVLSVRLNKQLHQVKRSGLKWQQCPRRTRQLLGKKPTGGHCIPVFLEEEPGTEIKALMACCASCLLEFGRDQPRLPSRPGR